jgi:hypothetical protein
MNWRATFRVKASGTSFLPHDDFPMAYISPPIVPKISDKKMLSFCETICPDEKPFHVLVHPEPESIGLQCFQNVQKKVKKSGGYVVYGWDICQLPKIHLEATFHAIWQSNDGRFVDVTPEAYGQTQILFLRDRHRTYNGQEVARHRFALGERKLVERYWYLFDEYQRILAQLLLAGFPRGDAIYEIRLGCMSEEMLKLTRKLNDA